jgi:Ca2+-binding RTX toxin-like protein
MRGGPADDRLNGGGGNDDIDGRGGADRLAGGPGDDMLAGGDGNDLIEGGLGADRIDAGAGDDAINMTTSYGLVEHGLTALLSPDFSTREGRTRRSRAVCGAGTDSVVADGDVLAADCEQIVLTLAFSPSRATPILNTGTPRPRISGRRVTIRIPCVAGIRQGGRCEATVTLRTAAGKQLARRKVVLRRTTNVTLRLKRRPPRELGFGIFAFGFGPGSARAETSWVAEY